MRSAALKTMLAAAALCGWSKGARACSDTAPCIDAEPLWHSPSAGAFVLVSDSRAPEAGGLGANATLGFRLKPAVLLVPAPNAEGREVNLISHATDLSLGARLGIGRGMELTLALPAGLYQRGAGIKGVTHQSAPAISEQALHDPRVGYGLVLLRDSSFGLKLRLELKLPLGDGETLAGEAGPVLSPTYAVYWRLGHVVLGGEAGLRLRSPTDFYGRRVGTQVASALGVGYALTRPHLAFTLEAYVLRSLVEHGGTPDAPSEWLASTTWTPHSLPRLMFGLAGGTGIALPRSGADGASGVGTPLMRLLGFVRWAPG